MHWAKMKISSGDPDAYPTFSHAVQDVCLNKLSTSKQASTYFKINIQWVRCKLQIYHGSQEKTGATECGFLNLKYL